MTSKNTPNKQPPKMRLEDLQHKRMDWSQVDNLLDVECPKLMATPLNLVNVIQQTNILANPDIEEKVVLQMLSKIKVDAESMAASYHAVKANYLQNKEQFRYEEDAFMFSIQLADSISDWTATYQDTVIKACDDVIEYINSKLSPEEQIPTTSN